MEAAVSEVAGPHPGRRFEGWHELYRSYQRKPGFHGVERIVSFYGSPGTHAGFYGVYQVLGHRPGAEGSTLDLCPWSRQWNSEVKFFHDLKRDSRFDDLRNRLIIDWGRGRNWVQNLRNKPVLEIQEPGRELTPFDDYLESSLTYDELKSLFENEGSHRDWQVHLSAVGGVYLILAEGSGDMYVGSASGESGIWGRWREYATSGDGGNARLREPIRREELNKRKLGTRAKGLN
jgi:hypothetical protein